MRPVPRRLLRLSSVLVVVCGVSFGGYQAWRAWQAHTVRAWIRDHSLPLAGVDPRVEDSDLAPLGAQLQGVRIVALGEQTHDTHEFFLLKHRLLKYLVTRLGFRAFVLEASRARCRPINDYVLYGRGDLNQVVHGQGFFTWDTKEFADLVEWMRDYNRGVSDAQKIQFFGMDVQLIEPAIATIDAYLKKLDSRDAEDARSALKLISAEVEKNPFLHPLSSEHGLRLHRAAATIENFLDLHRHQLARRGASEFAIVRTDAHQMAQLTDSIGSSFAFFDKRDTYMAENVRDLLDQLGPQARIVLWAHNYHISAARPPHSALPMGELLRSWYGPAYFAIGFSFGRGSFRARPWPTMQGPAVAMAAHPPDEGSVDNYLDRACAGRCTFPYLLVLRHGDDDAPRSVHAWLHSGQAMRTIGANYDSGLRQPLDTYHLVPAQTFDALAYVPESSPSIPLPP